MLPPMVRPRERIRSRSFVKPKVRARAMSLLYLPLPMSKLTCWPVASTAGWLNSISKVSL